MTSNEVHQSRILYTTTMKVERSQLRPVYPKKQREDVNFRAVWHLLILDDEFLEHGEFKNPF